MRLRRLVLNLLLISLVGCIQKTPIDFAADPSILRGQWQGIMDDYPSPGVTTSISLQLEATYMNESRYAFTGTIQLGDAPVRQIEGMAHSAEHETFVQPQIPAPIPAGFNAFIPELGFQMCAVRITNTPSYQGTVVLTVQPDYWLYGCSGQHRFQIERSLVP